MVKGGSTRASVTSTLSAPEGTGYQADSGGFYSLPNELTGDFVKMYRPNKVLPVSRSSRIGIFMAETWPKLGPHVLRLQAMLY